MPLVYKTDNQKRIPVTELKVGDSVFLKSRRTGTEVYRKVQAITQSSEGYAVTLLSGGQNVTATPLVVPVTQQVTINCPECAPVMSPWEFI